MLLLDSWRPRGKGAAALVFDWAACRLEVVFDAHSPRQLHRWGQAPPSAQSPPASTTPSGAAAGGPRQTSSASSGGAPAAQAAAAQHPVLPGGRHLLTDEECEEEYEVYVDPKGPPPVPDMNPEVSRHGHSKGRV